MLNFIISLAISALSAALMMKFVTDSMPVVVAVAIVAFFLPFILIVRVVMKKVEALMMSAQQDVMANRADKAIAALKDGIKYGQWQFYVKQQIFSQIGSILYMKRDFNEAIPYLEKGFVRNWVSMAMLGIAHMKKNKTTQMNATFDKAVSGSAKEPMIYALYAFCLEKSGDRQKAISILEKGLKKTAKDDRLQENIELLQAGKKMKMKGFGDMWYQFHLEKQGALIKKQTKAMTGRRKQVVR
jgi:tetratricopeptide (TPR) repeat protein